MRKVILALMLLPLSPCRGSCQQTSFQLAGIAINRTNGGEPTAAPTRILVQDGVCKLTVSEPLTGSGVCHISYSADSGKLRIVSSGPPSIVWTGTVKGNLASGTYSIDSSKQSGDFSWAIVSSPEPQLGAVGDIAPAPRVVPRSSCSPAVESTIAGDVEGWSGETIFKLDNGQIWQQAQYDYNYFYAYRPEVTIYQTSSGCRMKVEDETETILVKRLK